MPEDVLAQDNGKTAIPLDHFYVERQSGNIFRKLLRNLNFGASTGYGNTFFSHELTGFGIYQANGGSPQIFSGTTATRYGNWVNDVTIDKSVASPGFSVRSDTAKLGFKGNGLNIPLQIFLYYGFKDRYRIGAGYSYELMSIGSLHPTAYGNKIGDFQTPSPTGFIRKYYGFFGYSFYKMGEYLFTADLQVGNYLLKSNFNSALVTSDLYYNLGVTLERDFSEYFKVFVRPSFELKSYSIVIPESSKAIDHTINALYINVGVSYRIPELPRCFLKDCHVQINHAHGNKEYRSRRHPIYKKQNPGYGENDKTLIKYRGKNKKKLNPY